MRHWTWRVVVLIMLGLSVYSAVLWKGSFTKRETYSRRTIDPMWEPGASTCWLFVEIDSGGVCVHTTRTDLKDQPSHAAMLRAADTDAHWSGSTPFGYPNGVQAGGFLVDVNRWGFGRFVHSTEEYSQVGVHTYTTTIFPAAWVTAGLLVLPVTWLLLQARWILKRRRRK